ncbi:unnamed protein product [Amoebophrya sp. A25]|nr:unnamed protein product [Amoebophrya sp. A25]|eukprot:GSA25T00006378001.1
MTAAGYAQESQGAALSQWPTSLQTSLLRSPVGYAPTETGGFYPFAHHINGNVHGNNGKVIKRANFNNYRWRTTRATLNSPFLGAGQGERNALAQPQSNSKKNQRSLGAFKTGMSILKANIGSGLLFLPSCAAHGGTIVFTCGVIVVGALCVLSAMRLIRVRDLVLESEGVLLSYGELVEFVMSMEKVVAEAGEAGRTSGDEDVLVEQPEGEECRENSQNKVGKEAVSSVGQQEKQAACSSSASPAAPVTTPENIHKTTTSRGSASPAAPVTTPENENNHKTTTSRGSGFWILAVNGSIILLQCGFCIAYFISISQMVDIPIFGVAILVAPLTWIRHVAQLALTNIVADLLLLFATVVVFAIEWHETTTFTDPAAPASSMIREAAAPSSSRTSSFLTRATTSTSSSTTFSTSTTMTSTGGALVCLGTVCLVFEGISSVIPTRDEMANPERWGVLYSGCFVFITLLFIAAGLSGFYVYGEETKPIILLNFGSGNVAVEIVRAGFALALFLTFPYQFLPAVRIIESYCVSLFQYCEYILGPPLVPDTTQHVIGHANNEQVDATSEKSAGERVTLQQELGAENRWATPPRQQQGSTNSEASSFPSTPLHRKLLQSECLQEDLRSTYLQSNSSLIDNFEDAGASVLGPLGIASGRTGQNIFKNTGHFSTLVGPLQAVKKWILSKGVERQFSFIRLTREDYSPQEFDCSPSDTGRLDEDPSRKSSARQPSLLSEGNLQRFDLRTQRERKRVNSSAVLPVVSSPTGGTKGERPSAKENDHVPARPNQKIHNGTVGDMQKASSPTREHGTSSYSLTKPLLAVPLPPVPSRAPGPSFLRSHSPVSSVRFSLDHIVEDAPSRTGNRREFTIASSNLLRAKDDDIASTTAWTTASQFRKKPLKHKIPKAALRTFLVFFLAFVATVGENYLDNINSLIGSLCGAPLVFLYPALAHMNYWRNIAAITERVHCLDWMLITFGIIILIGSTAVNLCVIFG